MEIKNKDLLVILGPTASGKTRLGVRLAFELGGEVISADSRQVYRGLDIGAGKDLAEYQVDGIPVPYHLIDIVGLDAEFSVFDYQQSFYEVFAGITARSRLPVLVGGTGLYIEAVLDRYRMARVPENRVLRNELAGMDHAALVERLRSARGQLHNTTDTRDRDRLIRAIEITEYSKTHEPEPAPDIQPFVIGVYWDRPELRNRISERLRQRMDAGMIEEVEALRNQGVTRERLERLGLEYGHVARYLDGEIPNRNQLFDKLDTAIAQFAKRQMTWFRRMERKGTVIHWIPRADFDAALHVIHRMQPGTVRD